MKHNLTNRFIASGLALTLVMQTCQPAFAEIIEKDMSEENLVIINSVFNAEVFNTNNDKDDLLQRIQLMRNSDHSLYEEEQEGISLNYKNITIDKDEVFQLELLVDGEVTTNDVRWYCYTAYPEGLYEPSELQAATDSIDNPDDKIGAFVDDNGVVTGKVSRGAVIIWALYEDYLYPCIVNVRDYAQTKKNLAQQMAKDIITEHGINNLATRYEQALAVHDYLAENVAYDMNYLHADFEYDTLNDKKAVCNGYAKTFKMFMNILSIPCEYRSGYQGDSAHAWNIVQMDDNKWYYVDVTQDRFQDIDGNLTKLSHRKFLADEETFREWNYQLRDEDFEMGTEYVLYYYKENNMLASNEDEIRDVVEYQLNDNNSTSMKLYLAMPKTIPDGTVSSIVKEFQSQANVVSIQQNQELLPSGYRYVEYQLTNLTVPEIVDVDFLSASDITEDGISTSKLLLKFSEAVNGLSVNDIKVTGANKKSLTDNGNGEYVLYISNISVPDGFSITVSIAKSGYRFSPSSKSINVKIVKLSTPTVTATAISNDTIRLTGYTSETEYSIEAGEWIKLNDLSYTDIKLNSLSTINLINRSETDGILSSDMQTIKFTKQLAPQNLNAVDATSKEANGKITGVNNMMEYRKQDTEEWIACTSNEITGLSVGTYLVRYRANGLALASESVPVTIEETKNTESTTPGGSTGGESAGGSTDGGAIGGDSSNGTTDENNQGGSTGGDNSQGSGAGGSVPGGGSAGGSVGGGSVAENEESVTTPDNDIVKVNFTDIENHWARESIELVSARGIFAGTGDNKFSPNIYMTRGMFVTALGRLDKVDTESYTSSSFTDLKTDAYYMPYIEWASKNSIVNGIGNGKFAPNMSITREQMAVIISNYIKAISFELPHVNEENTFADSEKVNSYAVDAVREMQIAGILNGRNDNKFDPQATATRAEVCTVIQRLLEILD